MKKADAEWEKKNLGVSCLEITMENQDDSDILREAVKQSKHSYMVVKIPDSRMDLSKELASLKFTFVETLVHLQRNVEPIILNKKQLEKCEGITFTPFDQLELPELYSEIQKGMFHTDRIYLDPAFAHQKAAARYIRWINEELTKGSHLFHIKSQSRGIGFCGLKQSGKVFHQFLTGIYLAYQGQGLGYHIVYQPMKELLAWEGEQFTTCVSTNNLVFCRYIFIWDVRSEKSNTCLSGICNKVQNKILLLSFFNTNGKNPLHKSTHLWDNQQEY